VREFVKATGSRLGRPVAGIRPEAIFLGFAVILLGINHLSVVFGNGVSFEALGMGCWTGFVGNWALFAGRAFDVVWGWARRSMRRELGLGLFTFAIAIGLAEAVAWFAYGQHLWG
jgi:hypothetical protein